MVKNEATTQAASSRNATEALIALLDVIDEAPEAVELRQWSYELIGTVSGKTVADVGCGAGRAVGELAEQGARAIGFDCDETMVAVARRRWPAADFRIADAYNLPIGDGELDGYRAEKMYHDLADPARAIDEAKRVLVPGGRVVLIGQDWDTLVIDARDAALTRAIVQARADMVPGPRTARRYRSLLLDAGFRDVSVQVHTGIFTDSTMVPMLAGLAEAVCSGGVIERDRADAWVAEQRERGAAGRLFLAIPIFVASATRAGNGGRGIYVSQL
ncbi:methyltransferase domain-containing protein [Streptomyces sp. NPDC005004]